MHVRNPRHFKPLLPLACAVAVVVAGCGDGITRPPEPADVRPYVTGAAAAALTPEGTFILAEPASPTDRPIVGPERAPLLAASYVLSFGEGLHRHWEKDRGGPVDLGRLQPDTRVFYGSTPYAAFPEGYHPAFTHAFGPYYVVRLNTGSTPVLMVAVAAYATQVEIGPDGKIQRPVQRGNEFVSRGIPVDTARAFRTPEEAVVHVGRLTGARVEAVPELELVGLPNPPFSALWKLALDRPVPLRTFSGRRLQVREVYVGAGPGRRLMVPAADQPTEFVGPAIPLDAVDDDAVEIVPVPILPGRATVFEEALVDGAAQSATVLPR